jgi:hypothetical protein
LVAIGFYGCRELMVRSNDELAEGLRGPGCYRSIFLEDDLNSGGICFVRISGRAEVRCRVNSDPGTDLPEGVYVWYAPIFNSRKGGRADSDFACGGADTHAAAFALKHLAKDFGGYRLCGHGVPRVK